MTLQIKSSKVVESICGHTSPCASRSSGSSSSIPRSCGFLNHLLYENRMIKNKGRKRLRGQYGNIRVYTRR
jgi:hypothetical protein